jgi:hypothetical protein
MGWMVLRMEPEKTNRSAGDTPKTRKTSQSRKAKSTSTQSTPPPAAKTAAPVGRTVAPAKQGADKVVETKVVEVKSPIEALPPLEIPSLERPPINIPVPESPKEEVPAETASDRIDIHEGEIMATNDKQLTPAKDGQLVAQTSGGNADPYKVVSLMTIAGGQRPIMASTLEVKDMLTPNRPIFASDLVVYETINVSGIRPVMASPFEIVGSLDAAGQRPVAANEFEVAATMNVSGIRPIAASSLIVTEMLTATRPIASNDIDDSGTLMGYID